MGLSLIDKIRSFKVPEGPERPTPKDYDCDESDIAALQEIIGEIGDQLIALKGGIARLIDEVPRIDCVQMVERLEELMRDASDRVP